MKNLINFLKAVWKYMTTAGAWILFLFAISVSFLVFGGVLIFVESHRWIVMTLDATCVVLLTVAIRTRLERKFNVAGKLLFWSLFSNIVLLSIASFAALWNFVVMLFLLWPMAIGLSRINYKKLFWWLVDRSGWCAVIICTYSVSLAVLSEKEILKNGILSDVLVSLAAVLLVIMAVLITFDMFFNKKQQPI